MKISIFVTYLLVILILILCVVLICRKVLHEEFDDVHPLILDADDKQMKNSKWLWVIPFYNNIPISEDKDWIERLKKTNKKIGLHGVYHTHKEFGIDRDDEYIDKGINEFKKAFGYYPTHFKAPSLSLTKNNADKIRKRGIKIKSYLNQILHNVHHSTNSRHLDGRLIYENF